MNQIEKLRDDLGRRFPELKVTIDWPGTRSAARGIWTSNARVRCRSSWNGARIGASACPLSTRMTPPTAPGRRKSTPTCAIPWRE